MKQNSLENFMQDSNELISERIGKATQLLSKTNEYKKAIKEFNGIFSKLKDKYGNDIENLKRSLCFVKDLESDYTYMKCFIDGVTIREHFGQH